MPAAPPLPPQIAQMHTLLWPKLPHWAQNRIAALATGLTPSLGHSMPGAAQLQTIAGASVASAFPRATPEERNLLLFFLLSTLSGQAPSSTSSATIQNLQLAMDRRSKFVEALSNVMKKIDSTQATIVQNLKG